MFSFNYLIKLSITFVSDIGKMFNFGVPTTTSSGTSGGSFMLGNTTTVTPAFGTAAPAQVFSFGNLGAAPRSTLAATTTSSMAAPTFGSLTGTAGGFSSLAAPATSTSATTASSLFGSAAAPTASGYSFTTGPTLGGGFAAPSTTSGGIQFGLPTATSAPTPNFSAPATTTSASTFSLGGTSVQTAFTATPTATVGFNLAQATTQPASTMPRLPTATVTGAGGFSLPVASTAASTATPTLGGFTGGSGFMTAAPAATTAAATALTFNMTTSAPSSSTVTSTFLAPSSSTSTSSAGIGGSTSLSLAPLEEHINKWTLELEEQEKIFLNQATQVNAWDRMLLESGDKITSLNGTVENLKMEQARLELEVDYIMSQERELEEAIEPLEKAVESMTVTDSDRQQVYELAATLDSQTTQMAEQLKETIDHLNELNRAQDENNPVIQISRILNAHMNSLQWLEQTTNTTQNQLEETSKMIEMMKKDAEHPYTVSGYYH
ncbi:hypothetical protein B566_EDAN008453 [Ephemera danica]|nr:hypothetical protein B566_EDAN008453 [Ephemera danica]